MPAITPFTDALAVVGEVIAVPPGPDHAYVVAPVAAPLRVNVPPTHNGFGVALAVTPVGDVAVTVTAVVTPVALPQTLVAVIVYMPALPIAAPFTAALIAAGVVIAVPPGPVHKYVVAPVAAPLRVIVPPTQSNVGEALAVTPVGAVAVTLTDNVEAVVDPQVFDADKV